MCLFKLKQQSSIICLSKLKQLLSIQKQHFFMEGEIDKQGIEAKQLYLRNNIIDQGHDPQEFVSFCVQRYGQIDLDVWTFQKLSQVVQEYVKTISSTIVTNSESSEPEDQWNQYQFQNNEPVNTVQTVDHIIPPIVQPSNNIVFSDADWDFFLGGNQKSSEKKEIKNTNQKTQDILFINPNSKPQQKITTTTIPIKTQQIPSQVQPEKEKSVSHSPQNQKQNEQNINKDKKSKSKGDKQQKYEQCKGKFIRLQTSKVKQGIILPNISEVSIVQTEQVSRNFLQSDFTVYHILFRPCNHLIKRKLNDFRRLRSILQKLYPHINLPYIQPEGWLVSTSQGRDPQLLAKYKWMIIQFLKFIMIYSEELKNSQVVRDFTGFSKREVKEKEKEKQKDVLKKILDDYNLIPKPKFISQILTQNAFLIPYDPNYPKYISNHLTIIPEIDLLYDKLKKQLQALLYNYDILIKSLAEVTNTFQSLENTISKFNHQNNTNKQSRVYEGMRQMCIKLQNNLLDQSLMFKNRISYLFKYQKDNMWTIKQVLQHTSRVVSQYQKQGSPQSPLIKSQTNILDVESSIILDEPSKNKNILAIQYSFWQHIGYVEISSYWKGVRNKINEQLTLIAYECLDRQNQNLNFWNNIIKKCII